MWLATPGRALWPLLAICAGAILAPGIGITIQYCTRRVQGHVWSDFSDPRPGQIYDQYPLRWDELIWAGLCAIALGAALLALALYARILCPAARAPVRGSARRTPA